jgi:hypothetical protein
MKKNFHQIESFPKKEEKQRNGRLENKYGYHFVVWSLIVPSPLLEIAVPCIENPWCLF